MAVKNSGSDNFGRRLLDRIGLGGSCHWCTEAIFQALKGVGKVEQGWMALANEEISEAVIVHYDSSIIKLQDLKAVHLHTHHCTAAHPMREKNRFAIYTLSEGEKKFARQVLRVLKADFVAPILTEVLPFVEFLKSEDKYQN